MTFERFNHYAGNMEPDAPESIEAALENAQLTRVAATRNSYTVTHGGTAGGSVAQTLRRDGAAHSVELIPGDPSSRTSVLVAEQMGLLRNDQGRWLDVAAAERQAAEQALSGEAEEAQVPAIDTQAFPPAAEAALQAAVDPLPQAVYDTSVTKLMALALDGAGSLDAIGAHIATNSGMVNHQQGSQVAQQMLGHFEQAGTRALASVGIEGRERLAEFLDWARSGNRMQFASAAQQMVYFRNPGELKALGRAFADQRPGQEVQALRGAGIEVQRSGTGGWLVRAPTGGWMDEAASAQVLAEVRASLRG